MSWHGRLSGVLPTCVNGGSSTRRAPKFRPFWSRSIPGTKLRACRDRQRRTTPDFYAATFPERVSALVLVNTFARFVRAPDYPLGLPPRLAERYIEAAHTGWATMAQLEAMAPSMVNDEVWSR